MLALLERWEVGGNGARWSDQLESGITGSVGAHCLRGPWRGHGHGHSHGHGHGHGPGVFGPSLWRQPPSPQPGLFILPMSFRMPPVCPISYYVPLSTPLYSLSMPPPLFLL